MKIGPKWTILTKLVNKFLGKTLFINNEILLELYFRFIAQIITYYYYLTK